MNKGTSCQTMAIVSGKGGSGKTMLTATLAKILDSQGYSTLLVDADFGTAGLTYFLGLNEVNNISVGLTNIFSSDEKTALQPEDIITPLNSYDKTEFLGVGDHKRYHKLDAHGWFHKHFHDLLQFEKARNKYDFIIIDCRGGIDEDSLTVCKAVDNIIAVAETDTTSFQATQHLIEILYDNAVSHKVSGFYVNKVFDDPSTLLSSGTKSFKSSPLASIPFDLEAIRNFLVGKVPSLDSVYTSQVCYGLNKILKNENITPSRVLLANHQFSSFSFKDTQTSVGSTSLSTLLVSIFIILLSMEYQEHGSIISNDNYPMITGLFLSVLTLSDKIKKSFGQIISKLMRKRI